MHTVPRSNDRPSPICDPLPMLAFTKPCPTPMSRCLLSMGVNRELLRVFGRVRRGVTDGPNQLAASDSILSFPSDKSPGKQVGFWQTGPADGAEGWWTRHSQRTPVWQDERQAARHIDPVIVRQSMPPCSRCSWRWAWCLRSTDRMPWPGHHCCWQMIPR